MVPHYEPVKDIEDKDVNEEKRMESILRFSTPSENVNRIPLIQAPSYQKLAVPRLKEGLGRLVK